MNINKSNRMEGNNKPTTPVVDEISKVNFSGNIIPHSWYSHEIMRYDPSEFDIAKWAKAKSKDKMTSKPVGKPNPLAIILLSDCLYWYKATEIRDEVTNRILGSQRKFHADKLQKSHEQWAEAFGFTKRQVIDAVDFLEDRGLISVELRTVHNNKGKAVNNVMFVEPIPETVKLLTESQSIVVGEKVYHVITPYHVITGEPTTFKRGTNTKNTDIDQLTILNTYILSESEEAQINLEDQDRSHDGNHEHLLGSESNDLGTRPEQTQTQQCLDNSGACGSELNESMFEPEVCPGYYESLLSNETKYREDGYELPTWKTATGEILPIYEKGKRPKKVRKHRLLGAEEVNDLVWAIVECFGYHPYNCPRMYFGAVRDFISELDSKGAFEPFDDWETPLGSFIYFYAETFDITPLELPEFVNDYLLYKGYIYQTGVEASEFVTVTDGNVTLDWPGLIKAATGENDVKVAPTTYSNKYAEVDQFTEKLYAIYPFRITGGDGAYFKWKGSDTEGKQILRSLFIETKEGNRKQLLEELWERVSSLKKSRRIPQNFESFVRSFAKTERQLEFQV